MKTIAQSEFGQKLYTRFKEAYIQSKLISDGDLQTGLIEIINSYITAAPGGAARTAQHEEYAAADALPKATTFFRDAAPESVSMMLLGEAHTNAQDTERGKAFAAAMDTLDPNIIVLEKGMKDKYKTKVEATPVREETLTTGKEPGGAPNLEERLTIPQRSMVVAAYLVLITAGGPQTGRDKIFLFYGERHRDIFEFFDFFAARSNAAHLLRRQRRTVLVKSFA